MKKRRTVFSKLPTELLPYDGPVYPRAKTEPTLWEKIKRFIWSEEKQKQV